MAAGYTVPRNRKRDYLTTEERERKAERTMTRAEWLHHSEMIAQRERYEANETHCGPAPMHLHRRRLSSGQFVPVPQHCEAGSVRVVEAL